MQITINLDETQTMRLKELSRGHRTTPQEFVEDVVNRALNDSATDIEEITKRIIEENKELLRRLS